MQINLKICINGYFRKNINDKSEPKRGSGRDGKLGKGEQYVWM